MLKVFFSLFWVLSLISLARTSGAATANEVLKKIQGLAPAQRKAVLEEGARKEGQVVIYTSISLSDYPKIFAAFEQA
ncbi:MAG: ABC transporter substrate-binding protein, partial [Candidatus Binatia bacterium]